MCGFVSQIKTVCLSVSSVGDGPSFYIPSSPSYCSIASRCALRAVIGGRTEGAERNTSILIQAESRQLLE